MKLLDSYLKFIQEQGKWEAIAKAGRAGAEELERSPSIKKAYEEYGEEIEKGGEELIKKARERIKAQRERAKLRKIKNESNPI